MERLGKIIETGALINSTLDLNNLLILVMNTAAELVNAEAGSVLFLDEKTDELIFKVVTGSRKNELSEFRIPSATGVVGWVVREGKPALVNDTAIDDRFSTTTDEKLNYTTRSILAVPLVDSGKIIGALETVNKMNGKFTQDDLKILNIFAHFVVVAIDNAKIFEELKNKNECLELEIREAYEYVGNSPKSQAILNLINQVAPTDATVLITGESGTGKEVVARRIHSESNRSDKAFVKVSCAAIPDNLLESEFFGHERGAFTGATEKRKGRFELAHNGTLFLDEVGELPLNLQSKLLRVLQEREFERVGGTKTIKTDVRVLAATNKNLKAAIEDGEFREDLYYRLNVVPIHVPPLRENKEDLDLLVSHFIAKLNCKVRPKITAISEEAMKLIKEYDWPGNVRELENSLERVAILGKEEVITPTYFPVELKGDMGVRKVFEIPETATLPSMEKKLILKALENNNGNQTKASIELGITRDKLRYRLEKFDIDPSQFKNK